MDLIHNFFSKSKSLQSINKVCDILNTNYNSFKNLFHQFQEKKIKIIEAKEVSSEKGNSYIRNVIFRNDDYEIIIIKWNPKSKTTIHDHASRGCCMLLLDGSLKECRYTYLQDSVKLDSTNYYSKTKATYIDNTMYVHCIENDTEQISYSIHIYSPPLHKAKVYDSNLILPRR